MIRGEFHIHSRQTQRGERMWRRLVSVLRCPICIGSLELRSLSDKRVSVSSEHIDRARRRGVFTDDFNVYVDTGLLMCSGCRLKFPIMDGLPILLPYRTPLHTQFDMQWESQMRGIREDFCAPSQTPVTGEEFVATSFSTEWLAYDYDGVIWELSYDAHKERIMKEIGLASSRWHLEVGSGLGIATNVAQESFECDAIGLDLSLASLKATRQFACNPFLHFVQASVFAIPLRRDFFDTIYSRGVLHHTYSTESAFKCLASHCRNDNTLYIWLYNRHS